MVISIILVLTLVYLTFAVGIAYWILSHATKQAIWLKILGFIIGGVILTLATILMITTSYYGIKHRHDYYKRCPIYKMMQMHRQYDNENKFPCPMSTGSKTEK